jgi:hypothetical protein
MKKVVLTFTLMLISSISTTQTSSNNFSAINIIYKTKEPAKYICINNSMVRHHAINKRTILWVLFTDVI